MLSTHVRDLGLENMNKSDTKLIPAMGIITDGSHTYNFVQGTPFNGNISGQAVTGPIN
jgi:hypothetical protein